MVNQTLARRYANAVVSLARERDAVDRVGSDLQAVTNSLGAPGLARDFFLSPVINRPDKERLLLDIFGERIHEVALHTLLLLVRKRRENLLGAILTEYRALERAARGREMLTVTSARSLDRAEYARLIERLERQYGKKFDVTEVVDPGVIGGLRVMMGDRRIDDTISGRLEALARELFANN